MNSWTNRTKILFPKYNHRSKNGDTFIKASLVTTASDFRPQIEKIKHIKEIKQKKKLKVSNTNEMKQTTISK